MSQTQTIDDPLWPRASAWLAGECADETLGSLAVIGAPVARGSITPGRADLAPAAVRVILRKLSCYDIEADVDLRRLVARDGGDLSELTEMSLADTLAPISQAVRGALGECDAVALLGGDNSVTRPGCHGLADSLEGVGLLTLDAHFDLRDLTNGLTNGNPVRALLADGLPGRQVVQIGIQPFANSRAYAEVARDAGITVVTMNQVRERGIEAAVSEALDYLSAQVKAIYVDFDIDVLDRAFAPATPGSRPGGLTPWELRRAAYLCGSHLQVRAVDFVEVDPTKDIADATLLATGQCLLAFASGLVTRLSRGR
jgi:formiminoglutamase